MDECVQVRCCNSVLGCKWTGSQANLEEHLKSEDGCLWVDVECPNRCISGYEDNGKEIFVTVKRKCLKEHLEKECLRRVYECECGMKDEYSKIVNEHQPIDCCEWYTPCKNGCGFKIKRKEIDAHQCVCTELIIECPYARIGCDKGEIRQCELIAHLHSHREQHGLYSRRDDEHKRELKAQVDHLEGQVRQLKAQLRLSEQKVAELEGLKAENEQKVAELEGLKAENDSKFSAISTDVNIVKSNPCNRGRELALNSIQTQLKATVNLGNSRKHLVLRMTDFSGYQRRGKVWRSRRFNVYCQSLAYEMFISVFPRGIGSGMGTHVSIKLHCVCSEHHELTPWPTLEGFISVHLMSKARNPMGIHGVFQKFSCSLQYLPQRNQTVPLCSIEKFATVETIQENIIDDSIALIVEHSDFVMVEMPAVAHNVAHNLEPL